MLGFDCRSISRFSWLYTRHSTLYNIDCKHAHYLYYSMKLSHVELDVTDSRIQILQSILHPSLHMKMNMNMSVFTCIYFSVSVYTHNMHVCITMDKYRIKFHMIYFMFRFYVSGLYSICIMLENISMCHVHNISYVYEEQLNLTIDHGYTLHIIHLHFMSSHFSLTAKAKARLTLKQI